MRGALASEIGSLGTVPMAILPLCEVLKCQGIPGARKLPAISIALDEYVFKTYPDIKKSHWASRTITFAANYLYFFLYPQNRKWW